MNGRMPIAGHGFSVPLDLLNEEWAQRNHLQSLKVLSSRGGLSPCEAAAIIERRPWRHMKTQEALRVINAANSALEIRPPHHTAVEQPLPQSAAPRTELPSSAAAGPAEPTGATSAAGS